MNHNHTLHQTCISVPVEVSPARLHHRQQPARQQACAWFAHCNATAFHQSCASACRRPACLRQCFLRRPKQYLPPQRVQHKEPQQCRTYKLPKLTSHGATLLIQRVAYTLSLLRNPSRPTSSTSSRTTSETVSGRRMNAREATSPV
jgi:hypothetical protein